MLNAEKIFRRDDPRYDSIEFRLPLIYQDERNSMYRILISIADFGNDSNVSGDFPRISHKMIFQKHLEAGKRSIEQYLSPA